MFNAPHKIVMHVMSNKKQEANTEAKQKWMEGNKTIKVFDSIEKFMRKSTLFPDFYAPNPK